MKNPKFKERIDQYLSLCPRSIKLKEFLGNGTDGEVWSTNRNSAIKACERESGYFNERDSYQRLADFGVGHRLGSFWIPEMVGYNDELMIVEMDFMQTPPYVIDFAKVKIDRPPDFSEQVLEYQEREGQERFGENWPKVKCLLADLESYQIYYLDPSPNNIVFPKAVRD